MKANLLIHEFCKLVVEPLVTCKLAPGRVFTPQKLANAIRKDFSSLSVLPFPLSLPACLPSFFPSDCQTQIGVLAGHSLVCVFFVVVVFF